MQTSVLDSPNAFRVLRTNGTLIFKWNEHEVRVSEVLGLTDAKPLFGNRCGKTAKSHWIVFMKDEKTLASAGINRIGKE